MVLNPNNGVLFFANLPDTFAGTITVRWTCRDPGIGPDSVPFNFDLVVASAPSQLAQDSIVLVADSLASTTLQTAQFMCASTPFEPSETPSSDMLSTGAQLRIPGAHSGAYLRAEVTGYPPDPPGLNVLPIPGPCFNPTLTRCRAAGA